MSPGPEDHTCPWLGNQPETSGRTTGSSRKSGQGSLGKTGRAPLCLSFKLHVFLSKLRGPQGEVVLYNCPGRLIPAYHGHAMPWHHASHHASHHAEPSSHLAGSLEQRDLEAAA